MKNKLKIGVIGGIVAALLALTITLVGAGVSGRPAGNGGATVLQVANLSCGACLNHIESELRKNKGMVGMTADLAAGQITVKHTAELTPERLAELVTGVGYPAKVASSGTAAAPGEAVSKLGCKGCAPKEIAAPKCNVKNCDPKTCDHKNCDKKECEPKGCDKKGCNLPVAEKS